VCPKPKKESKSKGGSAAKKQMQSAMMAELAKKQAEQKAKGK